MLLASHTPPLNDLSLCAVVITYNPCPEKLRPLLQNLQSSNVQFVLIDNFSENLSSFKTWVKSLPNCLLFESNSSNVGHAQALNHALSHVDQLGYALAMLFDQDSSIPDNFINAMTEAWHKAQAVAPRCVAAIGPRLVDPRNQKKMPFRLFDKLFEGEETVACHHTPLFETAFLITSGTLLSLEVFKAVGPMRSDYFIDNVDLEWCFRARNRGFRLFGTDHAIMHHHIGEDGKSFWVRNGIVVQHNPVRYYYSTRNRLHLHKQSYAPWAWRVKDWVRFMMKSLYLFVGSPARLQYLKQLTKAVHDRNYLP